jgi:hypothetical protein
MPPPRPSPAPRPATQVVAQPQPASTPSINTTSAKSGAHIHSTSADAVHSDEDKKEYLKEAEYWAARPSVDCDRHYEKHPDRKPYLQKARKKFIIHAFFYVKNPTPDNDLSANAYYMTNPELQWMWREALTARDFVINESEMKMNDYYEANPDKVDFRNAAKHYFASEKGQSDAAPATQTRAGPQSKSALPAPAATACQVKAEPPQSLPPLAPKQQLAAGVGSTKSSASPRTTTAKPASIASAGGSSGSNPDDNKAADSSPVATKKGSLLTTLRTCFDGIVGSKNYEHNLPVDIKVDIKELHGNVNRVQLSDIMNEFARKLQGLGAGSGDAGGSKSQPKLSNGTTAHNSSASATKPAEPLVNGTARHVRKPSTRSIAHMGDDGIYDSD